MTRSGSATDAVGEFMAQWERERPDLDVAPMALVGRLFRASNLVGRQVREFLVAEGLEPGEFDVLATLRRCGPPHVLTPGALAASTMVGGAAMTNRLDRLAGRGLLTRETDPGNRRSLLVTLTPEGLALVDRVVEGHVANERRILDALSATERRDLDRLLRALLVSLGDVPPPA